MLLAAQVTDEGPGQADGRIRFVVSVAPSTSSSTGPVTSYCMIPALLIRTLSLGNRAITSSAAAATLAGLWTSKLERLHAGGRIWSGTSSRFHPPAGMAR